MKAGGRPSHSSSFTIRTRRKSEDPRPAHLRQPLIRAGGRGAGGQPEQQAGFLPQRAREE